jgi:hypothetical protein
MIFLVSAAAGDGNNTESVVECDSRTVSCSGDHAKSLSTWRKNRKDGDMPSGRVVDVGNAFLTT